MFGWRSRIGVIIPSANTTVEPEFAARLPDGVSLHTSRIRSFGVTPDALGKMNAGISEAAESLRDAGVSVIAYACTSGGFTQSATHADDLDRRMTAQLGLPFVSTSRAVIAACRKLALTEILLATPYSEEVNRREVDYLNHYGIDVSAVAGLGHALPRPSLPLSRASVSQISLEPAYMSYALAKRLSEDHGAGDVFLSCTNFRTLDILPTLERDLNRVVISSNQVTLWAALTLARAADQCGEPGQLFARRSAEDLERLTLA